MYIYIYIHLKATSVPKAQLALPLFFLCLLVVVFTSLPLVCFGWSLCDMCTAPPESPSGFATWSPQVGTCCCRHHPRITYHQVKRKSLVTPDYPKKELCTSLETRHPSLGGRLHGRPAHRVGLGGERSDNECHFWFKFT